MQTRVMTLLGFIGTISILHAQIPDPQFLQPAERHARLRCEPSGVSMRDSLVNTAPVGAHLTYYGGKVISNVKLVMVLYGTNGTYASFLTNDAAPSMLSFYQQMVNSTYMDWLCEYSTPSQTIGRGSFAGKFSIVPLSTNNRSTITDANIQSELARQITAGTLPAPDSNTLYMVHFPKGKSITFGTARSCVSGGFCAYHGTFFSGTSEIYYGVLPDMSAGSGCDLGCGSSSSPLTNQCSVASHEIIEAITDPEVGVASSIGFPLAWYDAVNGEIGVICNAMQSAFVGADGHFYGIQEGWSNHDNNCIAVRLVLAPLASAQTQVTYQGLAKAITLAGIDINVCPRSISFTVVSSPAHGSLSGLAPALTYTPDPTYSGADTFQFKVNNGVIDSTPATVSINIVSTLLAITPLPDGNMRVSQAAITNSPFRLLATDYLTNPIPWATIQRTNSGPNTFVIFDDLDATNHPQRTYRTATP